MIRFKYTSLYLTHAFKRSCKTHTTVMRTKALAWIIPKLWPMKDYCSYWDVITQMQSKHSHRMTKGSESLEDVTNAYMYEGVRRSWKEDILDKRKTTMGLKFFLLLLLMCCTAVDAVMSTRFFLRCQWYIKLAIYKKTEIFAWVTINLLSPHENHERHAFLQGAPQTHIIIITTTTNHHQ